MHYVMHYAMHYAMHYVMHYVMHYLMHFQMHFQCSFNDVHLPVHTFKRPLTGDCRDLASLNAVQLILSALCGAV